jgi:hypothetical protein
VPTAQSEYSTTPLRGWPPTDNDVVPDDGIDAYEAALRQLPEAHSLALRLKRAGVADEVVCGYLHIEPEGLDILLRIAERKLDAELHKR